MGMQDFFTWKPQNVTQLQRRKIGCPFQCLLHLSLFWFPGFLILQFIFKHLGAPSFKVKRITRNVCFSDSSFLSFHDSDCEPKGSPPCDSLLSLNTEKILVRTFFPCLLLCDLKHSDASSQRQRSSLFINQSWV